MVDFDLYISYISITFNLEIVGHDVDINVWKIDNFFMPKMSLRYDIVYDTTN